MIAREELGDVPADKKKMKVSTFSLTRHAKIFGPLVSDMADMRHVIYWAELYLEIWFNQTWLFGVVWFFFQCVVSLPRRRRLIYKVFNGLVDF